MQPESNALDVAALRIREATIAVAVPMTFGVSGLGLLYAILTWQRPHRLELTLLFALSAVSVIGVYKLRGWIVRSRWREALFLSWTLSDFAMIVAGTLADGGTRSPLVLVFFMPVVFSATSYPLASVVAVGTVSIVSFLSVALIAGGASAAYQVSFTFALLCTAAMSAWQAQNHKRQNRALATASRTDPLTGCLNRRGFEERATAELAALARRGRGGAIVVLDIDKFKPVNDMFGHAAGDELLCWVARTLEDVVRPSDAIGRLGGDEFAVLLAEIGPDEARERATAIADALADRAPASLGVALCPEDGTDLETLTRRADTRLYGTRRVRYGRERTEGAAGIYEPDAAEAASAGVGPIELWRAALQAMPTQGRHQHGAESGPDASLLDEIDASVVATDMEGNVISWNRGAERLYGWSAEEAIGASARDLVVPEDTAAAERLAAELSRDGRWDGELEVRHKDGSLFTAYVRNRLVVDAEGAPSAIVGVAVDISERKQREAEVRRSAETLAVLQRVEEAIVQERFVLYAQPIVDLRTGDTVRHELLLRMMEPDGTIVAPGEFLPVCEQNSTIGEIDWWVIRQAARLAGAGSPVQANISARSLGDPDVLEHIERCVEQSSVPPGSLVFEITETAVVEDQGAAHRFVERLHALGCGVALDDFGTGYSTLTYLKQMPVDHLKLDIEFVRDVVHNDASRHVIQAVISLAHDFGLETVAEGVEDGATLALLRELGVDFAQGFHLARPEPFLERPGDLSETREIDAARAPATARASEHRPSAERSAAPAGAAASSRVRA